MKVISYYMSLLTFFKVGKNSRMALDLTIVGLPQISFFSDPNVFLSKNLLQVCILNTILQVFFWLRLYLLYLKAKGSVIANTRFTKCQLSASESRWPQTNARSFLRLDLMLMTVLALGMREASKIAIAGNFYENTSSFKFVFHEKWLPFKRLNFNNCTGPNKVRIELTISKINNHIEPN